MFGKRVIFSLLIVILSVIAFSNSFNVPFLWDDEGLVTFNYYLRNPFDIEQYLTTSGMRQRPITVLSLVLNFQISQLSSTGYHITQVLLHTFVSLLLSLIAYELYPSLLFSFLSGAFFALHPLHTEAVNLLLGRSDILSLLFVLLSFYFYIFYLRKNDGFKKSYYAFSLFFFLMGLFSKETAFFFPVAFFVFYLEEKKKKSPREIPHLRNFLPFISGMIIYAVFWFFMVVRWTDTTKGSFSSKPWGGGIIKTILLQIEVFGHYLKLVFFPFNLKVWYEATKEVNYFVMFSSLFFIVLFICYLYSGKKFPLTFFLVWVVAGVLPITNIIPIPGSMAAERWTYPSTAGLALAAAFLCERAYCHFKEKSKGQSIIFAVCLSLILLFFASATFERNRTYGSETAFYMDMIEKDPDSGIIVVNYGMTLVKRGEYDKAIEILEKYIRSGAKKFLDQAFNHLGLAYEAKGKMELAFKSYEAAYRIDRKSVFSIVNLANQYINRQKYYEARKLLDEALEVEPENADANYAYGLLFDSLREYRSAMEKYRESIKYKPNVADVHNNLGLDLYRFEKYDEAVEELKKAISIDPDYLQAYGNMGIVLLAKEDYEGAKKYFRKLLEFSPGNSAALQYLKEAEEKAGEKAEK